MAHGATFQYVTGSANRDDVISSVTGSEEVLSVRLVGGYQTHGSSSYNFGLGGSGQVPPVDNTIWELLISNGG